MATEKSIGGYPGATYPKNTAPSTVPGQFNTPAGQAWAAGRMAAGAPTIPKPSGGQAVLSNQLAPQYTPGAPISPSGETLPSSIAPAAPLPAGTSTAPSTGGQGTSFATGGAPGTTGTEGGKSYTNIFDESLTKATQAAQGEISKIEEYFGSLLQGAERTGRQEESAVNAMALAAGMAGSGAAEAGMRSAKEATGAQKLQISGQLAGQVANIYKDIWNNAKALADASQGAREFERTQGLAESQFEEGKREYDQQRQDAIKEKAQKNFEDLAKITKKSFDDLKKLDPAFASELTKQAGYSETEAAFKWNSYKSGAEQIQWQAPQKSDNGFLFYGLDPVTGQIKTQEVKIAAGNDWSYSPANKYQDGVMVNKKTGQVMTVKDYEAAIPGNVEKLAPNGSNGGQCGDFMHTIVDNVPPVGDSKEEKMQFINQYGTRAADWNPKIGDVIVQTIGTYGHIAVVNKVNTDGTVQVTESNFDGTETVNNNRVLSAKDSSIFGAYTKGNLKGSIADGTKSKREMALDLEHQKSVAALERTKQLTESSKMMVKSRANTIVRGVMTQLYGSATKSPVALFNNSAAVMNRIAPSLKQAIDSGTVAKNVPDLDLIDAYVQIARGGQQITEAQVDTLLTGMGVKAKFDSTAQKITGSAILDDSTRKQLASTAKSIYKEYEKSANNAVNQINNQLRKQGIPEEYMLNKPEDITGVLAGPKISKSDFEKGQAMLQSGEVLAVDESGNYVAATQEEINSGEYTPVEQE